MAVMDNHENTADEQPGLSVDEQFELLTRDSAEELDLQRTERKELPEWFDPVKFRRGQEFFRDNYFSLFVSKLSGLLVVMSIPNILNILIMTHKSSSPKTAFKRYFSTLSHMLLWYNGDVTDCHSRAYKSLTDVNTMHVAANRRGKKEKVGLVSQSSLALTQFGFMGMALVEPAKLGVHVKDEQSLEGFVHFWRAIGYFVGLEDRFNICRGSVEETRDLCRRILLEVYKPRLATPSEDFTRMARFLLHGMWAMVPHIDEEAFFKFTCHIAGIKVKSFTNWYSRLMFNLQVYVHKNLLGSRQLGGVWRAVYNFQMWLSVLITSKFPFLAYYAFGRPL